VAKQEPAAAAKKSAKAAAAAAAGEDEDEVPMRKETKVFWCVDYPRLKDSLRLRLHRVREFIKEQVGGWACCGASAPTLRPASSWLQQRSSSRGWLPALTGSRRSSPSTPLCMSAAGPVLPAACSLAAAALRLLPAADFAVPRACACRFRTATRSRTTCAPPAARATRRWMPFAFWTLCRWAGKYLVGLGWRGCKGRGQAGAA
jgi:hypothetical protein